MSADETDPQVEPLTPCAQTILAALDGDRQLADGDLVEVCAGDGAHRTPSSVAVLARWAWTNWTAIEPSPTAVAQRLVDPERTSPAANTPGTSVSGRFSMFAAAPGGLKPLAPRPSVSRSHSVHGSAPRKRNRNEYARSSPLVSVTAARCPFSPWSAAISLRSRTTTPH